MAEAGQDPEQANFPLYTGVLQTNNKNPKFRKKIGRIALWNNRSKNPRAPVPYGQIATNYGKSVVALWRFEAKKETSGV